MSEPDALSPVTVIGLGFMGSALVAEGAVRAATIADAAAASPVVVVCVFDRAAVRQVPSGRTCRTRSKLSSTAASPTGTGLTASRA